jgi:hypothetical protein
MKYWFWLRNGMHNIFRYLHLISVFKLVSPLSEEDEEEEEEEK